MNLNWYDDIDKIPPSQEYEKGIIDAFFLVFPKLFVESDVIREADKRNFDVLKDISVVSIPREDDTFFLYIWQYR